VGGQLRVVPTDEPVHLADEGLGCHADRFAEVLLRFPACGCDHLLGVERRLLHCVDGTADHLGGRLCRLVRRLRGADADVRNQALEVERVGFQYATDGCSGFRPLVDIR
jgi:hypothetical protein